MTMPDDRSTLKSVRAVLIADPTLADACRALAKIAHWPVPQQRVIDALASAIGEYDNKPEAAVLMARLVEVGVLRWFSTETAHLDLAFPRLLQELGFRKRIRDGNAVVGHPSDATNVPLPEKIGSLPPAAEVPSDVPDIKPAKRRKPGRNITAFTQDIDNLVRIVNLAQRERRITWPFCGKDLAEFVAQAIGEESNDPRPRTYDMMRYIVEQGIVKKLSAADWYWKGPSWPKPGK